MKRIAIGIGKNSNILKAVEIFQNEHDLDIIPIKTDDDLVDAILDDDIDAVIRGSLPASGVMRHLKKHFPDISRATYVNGNGHEFLLTPVGIDEGNTLDEKLKMAIDCGNFLKKLSKKPKIAVFQAPPFAAG